MILAYPCEGKVESDSFFEEAPVVESVSFMDMNITHPILKVHVICVEYRGRVTNPLGNGFVRKV